ncbi:hypothetical protein QOZ80_1AG0026860 [Eleusine coracana subsp. coracana]|nr:hypothetical protein QOZ80_1AG0026860 [Eleusine coracana subsp. coracana]
MVPGIKLPVAPAAAIFLSAVIVLSCFTKQLAPYLSYVDYTSAFNFSPNFTSPFNFSPNFTSPFNLSPASTTLSSPKCNIFRGDWVWDPDLPQYTNATCSYIYGNQNCLLFGRPDLDYLKWRWQPDECDLPRFDPYKFLQVVTNKTLAFVGDSLTRNHYQSLLCLLSKAAKPKDIVGNQYELNKVIYYETYNFTIHIFWTPFLVRVEKDPDTKQNRLYLDEADDKWLSKVHLFDYVLISGANWFSTPAYLYERGQLVGSMYIPLNFTSNLNNYYHHRMAFRTSLRALNDVNFRGKVIMRTLSPFSHWEGGEWDSGGDCKRTRPYGRNETVPVKEMEREFYKGQLEEFREAEKVAKARGAEMVLMDLTPAMRLRPDGHPSQYGHWPHEKRGKDCVHWCLPGPIDAWNDMLLHMLSN